MDRNSRAICLGEIGIICIVFLFLGMTGCATSPSKTKTGGVSVHPVQQPA